MPKAVLDGNTDKEKFADLCSMTHKDQIIWFLNAFWTQCEPHAELLWKWAITCAELDLQNHEDGSGLDEVNAHRFLELYNETMTVRELRDTLRNTGAIDAGRLKLVPITYVLIFKFSVDWHELVSRSQGDNREEMEAAQKMLNEVQAAFVEVRALQKAATEAEAPFKIAQEELLAALAEVKKQEDEYNAKIADCEARSEQGGVVSRNKAKAELAQLKAEDPLPLSRAKITLGAAEKRAAKARAPFEAARKEADAAVDDATKRVKEAEDYLNEVKSRPGQPYGALWWIDRELHEQKKYLPTSRGGIAK